jgi:ABC-2 type transport system permease protein
VIALLRSELLRMRSRRIVWVLVVASLSAIAVIAVILMVKFHKPTDAEVSRAHADFETQMTHCLNGDFELSDADREGVPLATWCRENLAESDFHSNEQFDLVNLPDMLLGTSFLVIVMGILIGASSIGAEWSAGSFATLLTWEPRRIRVLLIRLIVVAVTAALVSLFLEAVLGLVLSGVAALRGSTAGTGAAWLRSVLATIGRITVMAALTASVGLAIATVGRGTAAALGVLVGYLAIFENLLRGFRPSVQPLLLSTNVVAFLTGHDVRLDMPSGTVVIVSASHALVVTCFYVVSLMVLATSFLRARDVT